MQLFELVLIMLACVIASAVLDQVVSRMSLPLVQIAVGLLVALVIPEVADVYVESELFLVLFIAPLLFNEARHSNKWQLWQNKWSIGSLAIGLVIATVLVVGYTLNWLVPSIPLAAAFAMAGALGPTDAAAVTALGPTLGLSTRQRTLLSGEALINDASGVVSFQFAIAAAITGAFSATAAVGSFLLLFFGGIVFGFVIGTIARGSIFLMRRRGLEDTTVHVIYEVFTPFVVYLAAEAVHVSGILAVVAAGIVMARHSPRLTSTADARHDLVSNSVWEVIIFLINGVLFVLLGMQLPHALDPDVIGDLHPALPFLCIAVVTTLVLLVRFLWLSAMEFLHREDGARGVHHPAQSLRNALGTTLAGPKGAVTLSIIMTIPLTLEDGSPFPHRNLIIFLTAGVILCTLLLADLALPRITPKTSAAGRDEEVRRARITVLESVLAELRANMTTGESPEYEPALRLTVARYSMRLSRERFQVEGSGEVLQQLVQEVIASQQKRADEIQSSGAGRGYSAADAAPYYAALRTIRASVGYFGRAATVGSRFRTLRGNLALLRQRFRRGLPETEQQERIYYDTCLFEIDLENTAIDYLREVIADDDAERAAAAEVLLGEHRAALDSLWGRINFGQENPQDETRDIQHGVHERLPEGMRTTFGDQFRKARRFADEVDASALELELDHIRKLRQSGEISDSVARELRENVYVLQMALDN